MSDRDEVERWRGLVDHLPALVAFWDRDQRNVVANAAYEQWFGLTPQQVHGMHLREVLGAAVYRANLPFVEGALAGERQRFERTLVTSTGETRHTQADYLPDVSEDGVQGFYVLVSDITEKVEAQRDLVAAQRLARTGSYTFEPSTETLRLSAELLRILGHDPTGPGLTLTEYLAAVHPEDREEVEAVRAQAVLGQEYEASYRIIRPDGQVRHVHSRTTQVLGPGGSVLLLRGVMQDVSEVHRLADELAVKNRMLTDLIGMLGHDLSQPVAATNGYLEVLEHDWDQATEGERRALVRRASRTGLRVQHMLADILTVVHVESSELATWPSAVDVAALVAETADHLGIDLVLERETGDPAWADPVHVGRVVDNLLGNADRYGRPPYVVRLARHGDQVVLSLRDHGEGVPPDFVPHLFDRFARADSGVATTVRGTGLGLHLVRELVHANDGTVCHRVPEGGPGAVFEVRLPVATAAELSS